MESSSDDDSFIWTDVSNEDNSAGMDNSDIHGIQSEPDSDDDRKSFHKQSKNMTQEKPNHNKRKIKEESLDSKPQPQNGDESYDISKCESAVLDDTHNCVSEDESYLKMRVKREQMSVVTTTPVKSTKTENIKSEHNVNPGSDDRDEVLTDSYRCNKLENNSYIDVENPINIKTDDNTEMDSSQEGCVDMENSHKKKKSKKGKKIYSECYNDDTVTEYKVSQDDTVVNLLQKKKKKKKKKKTKERDEHMSIDEIENTQESNEECNTYSNDGVDSLESETVSNNRECESDLKNIVNESYNSTNYYSPDETLNTTTRKVPKISDRIQFEDEDSYIESPQNKDHKNDKYSKQVKHFLKANSNLKPVISSVQRDTVITQDDDIWILKCPQDIDISQLKDTDILLEAKCKMKHNGQRFDGNLNEDVNMVNILSPHHKKFSIGSVKLKGTVDFHKRVPKPHCFEDGVIENNLTNFVPLPETKCRHPLFGTSYKQDIKIPKPVAERLKAIGTESPSVIRKKNKNKIKRESDETLELEYMPQPHIKVKSEPETERKHKRKYIDEEGRSRKKSKKIKYDPDSADVWASEKAIEEKLFNY